MGRSQPGAAQLRCRALRPRHCAGETARVARPTSITCESAFNTRARAPSQARRCTVLLETGIPFCSSDADAPSSRFKPSIVVWTVMWGRTPLRRGSVPWFMAWCATSTSASARRCLGVRSSPVPMRLANDSIAVFKAEPPSRSSTRDVEHAARLADAEESLLVVLFDPVIEAVRVEHVADVLGQPVQVLD